MESPEKDFKIVRDDGSCQIVSLRPRETVYYDTEIVRSLDKWVTFFDHPLGYTFDGEQPKTPAHTNLMLSRALSFDKGAKETYISIPGTTFKVRHPEVAPVSVPDSFDEFHCKGITVKFVQSEEDAEDVADRETVFSGAFSLIIADRIWLKAPILLLDGKQRVSDRTWPKFKYCCPFYARLEWCPGLKIKKPVTVRVEMHGRSWSFL